jgi:hypothetical protein
MDVGHVIPEAIRELLEKRSTFQGWLDRLDDLGSDFRPEVAEKVRNDYSGRLAEVETKLEGHRTELETALADRSGAVAKVADEHDARSAELEETQLRHAVGEFDDDEWERRRSEHQVGIDELDAELTAQRKAVDSLQTVLGELTGAAAVIAMSEEVDAEPVEEATPEEDPVDGEGAEEAIEEVEAGEGDASEDQEQEAESAEQHVAWMTQPLDGPDVVLGELVEPEVVESLYADAEFVDAVVVETEAEGAEIPDVEGDEEEPEEKTEPEIDEGEPEEFMDELEFLESLSLDDADKFDAVSAMLDDEDGESDADGKSKEKTEDL